MFFLAVGFVLGGEGLGWMHLDIDGAAIHVLLELTLVLVLFTDAARIGETLGEPVIGRVRIKGFKVYFNDRLLGDMAEAELARKCREMLHRINGRN